VPYIFAGLKLYDILAGKMGIGGSRIVRRKEALKRFPMLRSEGLKAGVLYYDGQFNDARMAVTLMTTAGRQGAVTANHVEALSLVREDGRITGAQVRDKISGEPILKASSGIHIVLDKRFAPPETGLMIPKTEDGRVLFILPWQGHALIGTTDEPAEITDHPRPKEEEVAYLLRHISKYFDLEITEKDIKSTWSGLRPLLYDPKAADTARLARDHIIQVSGSGLLTIAGGKWTTYRKMAQDAVDHAVKTFDLSPSTDCITDHLPLAGAGKDRPAHRLCVIKEVYFFSMGSQLP